MARARPQDAGSGGGEDARGGWPNGTQERGRRGRGSQGRSVPALRGPGGPLTSLRPGALWRQPGSAAATAAPEPGSGHCRLRPRLRPCHAPATPAKRPVLAPWRPPRGGGPSPSPVRQGHPLRVAGQRLHRAKRGGFQPVWRQPSLLALVSGPLRWAGPGFWSTGPRPPDPLRGGGASAAPASGAMGLGGACPRAAGASPGPRWGLRVRAGWPRAPQTRVGQGPLLHEACRATSVAP